MQDIPLWAVLILIYSFIFTRKAQTCDKLKGKPCIRNGTSRCLQMLTYKTRGVNEKFNENEYVNHMLWPSQSPDLSLVQNQTCPSKKKDNISHFQWVPQTDTCLHSCDKAAGSAGRRKQGIIKRWQSLCRKEVRPDGWVNTTLAFNAQECFSFPFSNTLTTCLIYWVWW